MNIPGFGGGGQTSSAQSTSQTIFGGYNAGQNLGNLTPWLIGGAVVAVFAVALVIIAAIRK